MSVSYSSKNVNECRSQRPVLWLMPTKQDQVQLSSREDAFNAFLTASKIALAPCSPISVGIVSSRISIGNRQARQAYLHLLLLYLDKV